MYDAPQQLDLRLVAPIGSEASHIQLAGNMDCHVTCSYNPGPAGVWKIQVKGSPGDNSLSRGHDNPIVIEGLTEQDLQQQSEPTIEIVSG